MPRRNGSYEGYSSSSSAFAIASLASQRRSDVTGSIMKRPNASTSFGANPSTLHSPTMRAALAASRLILLARHFSNSLRASGVSGSRRRSLSAASRSSSRGALGTGLFGYFHGQGAQLFGDLARRVAIHIAEH